MQSEIIILCVDRNLLQYDLKFTDGNAASDSTKFFSEIKDLEKLNWSIINSRYWSDFIDGKRIRCSEILIPNEDKSPNNPVMSPVATTFRTYLSISKSTKQQDH